MPCLMVNTKSYLLHVILITTISSCLIYSHLVISNASSNNTRLLHQNQPNTILSFMFPLKDGIKNEGQTIATDNIESGRKSVNFYFQPISNSGRTSQYPTINVKSVSQLDPLHAKNYLVSQYNPTIGLIRENIYNDRYWLWSDNVLATKVLRNYNYSISENIDKSIKYYKSNYNIDMLSAYAVLVDQISKSSFRPSYNKNLVNSIWYTNYDGRSHDLSCGDYADIAFLKSIYLYKINNIDSSKSCYNKGLSMFDGVGFKDKAFYADGNLYSTYKIALWKLASKETGFGETYEPTNIMGKLQNPTTGGIYTHYDTYLSLHGQTNVETTSLVIMAYLP